MSKLFLTFMIVLGLSAPVFSEQVPLADDQNVRHYLKIPSGGLAAFLQRPSVAIPMISHHRGGPMPGMPENSIEAMDNALAYGYGLMEVDVAQLKDGTLILMHDDTLDRTTTGSGRVKDKSWTDVENLFLKDNNGSLTAFRIPTLKSALEWSIGRTILTLDIKRGTDFQAVADLVKQTDANDYSVSIAYSINQAKAFYRMAPEMPISIGLSNEDDIANLDTSGIPSTLVVAWTGTKLLEPSFYSKLHERGWRTIVGTLGRGPNAIDNQIRDKTIDVSYKKIVEMGADIIATDRFWAVQQEIRNPNLFIFIQQKLVN